MALTINQVFDKHFADVKIDRKFCERIINYRERFMNLNENHSAFFGGVLMGVNPVRFLDTDRELYYVDVLDIDEDLLRHDFIKAVGIDVSHKVGSEPINYIPGYLTTRLRKINDIPMNIRYEAMVSLFMIMHFIFITSLFVPRFKYPARKEVMEATFATFNYKFDIKALGSWGKLIRDRSEGIIAKNSIYDDFFNDKAKDPTYWAKRVVSDTQTRIRKLINLYYSTYIKVLNSGVTLSVTSEMGVSLDGEMILRDAVNGYANYINYVKSIIRLEDSFLKPELLSVINDLMPTMSPALLEKTLRHLSKNFNYGKNELLVEESLLYTFDLMQTIKSQVQRGNDLTGLMTRLRALITAPKSSDPRVLLIRTEGERLVKEATGIRNPAVLAATRTGVTLYVILRTMTRNYYTRG